MKKLLRMAAILAAACVMFASCSNGSGPTEEKKGETPAPTVSFPVENKATVIYPLGKTFAANDKVKIEMTGKNNGESGFRLYLINGSADNAMSNIYTGFKPAEADYKVGDFSITCELTAIDVCSSLMVKGPQYGTNIDNLIINSIKVDGVALDVTAGE